MFFPEIRSDKITGFYSIARAVEEDSGDYYWMTEPPGFEANYEPFTAEFAIPDRRSLEPRISSFFPILLPDYQVLSLIGKAYKKSGCRAYDNNWSVPVINPLTGQAMIIAGVAVNDRIETAYPFAPGVLND